ncbi:WAT1-related protein [Vitis vinifera]|uniref:WAT1-related protein n=1 Tax=Vitis vinifera TaxID=29760 RepID=A0A438JJE6_VITVI|nr:WAT1-related protein [Vitis vinifera]
MKTWGPHGAMVLVHLAKQGTKSNRLCGVQTYHCHAFARSFAYVLERTQRPSLSFSVMMKIFVLASLGTTIFLNVYYAGLHYTSATVASALSNGIPSLTFLMAVLFRMEEVRIQSARGRAKVLGTMVCIGGAPTFTFWKGGYLFNGFTERPLINVYSTEGSASEHHGMKNWIKGSVLILISHIAWSSWLILQAVVYKVYPARLSLNGLICFFASLQSSFLALIFARNPVLWKLEWNVQLLTIIYCGVVGSGLVYYLQTWCISKRGPVFCSNVYSITSYFCGNILSSSCFCRASSLEQGFPWGLLGGGGLFLQQQQHEVGGWLFRHGVWARVPGSRVGVFRRAKNGTFFSGSGGGGGGSSGVVEGWGFQRRGGFLRNNTRLLVLPSLIGAFLIIAGLYIVLSGKKIDGRSEGISKSKKGLDDDKILEISINDQPGIKPHHK